MSHEQAVVYIRYSSVLSSDVPCSYTRMSVEPCCLTVLYRLTGHRLKNKYFLRLPWKLTDTMREHTAVRGETAYV
jgi:hypothetical protein